MIDTAVWAPWAKLEASPCAGSADHSTHSPCLHRLIRIGAAGITVFAEGNRSVADTMLKTAQAAARLMILNSESVPVIAAEQLQEMQVRARRSEMD